MDYKFTFSDGSDAYLSHYGVKGMKWGVWNEETRQRRLGYSMTEGGGGGGVVLDDEDNVDFAKEHPDVFGFLKQGLSADEIMAGVNPMYGAGLGYYSMAKLFKDLTGEASNSFFFNAVNNCATCSIIYDLRRRGYDVDAAMTQNLGFLAAKGELQSFYEGAKTNKVKDSKISTMTRELSQYPDGARGVMWGTTVYGGGHAIAWEKENGKIVYRDCQTNKKYTEKNLKTVFSEELSSKSQNGIGYSRLDNCKPNLKKMYTEGIVSKSGKENSKEKIANTLVREYVGQTNRAYREFKREGYSVSDTGSTVLQYVNAYTKGIKDVADNKDKYAEQVIFQKER